MSVKMPEFPEPLDHETDDEYRVRLRAWFDSVETDQDEVTNNGQWLYICQLQGIAPF